MVNLVSEVFDGWNLVGGSTESLPSLTAFDSKLELVVRGLDNGIYYNTYDIGWVGWTLLSSGLTCDGVATTVIGNYLHIIVRGLDGNSLWHNNVNLSTSEESNWKFLTGITPSSPTI